MSAKIEAPQDIAARLRMWADVKNWPAEHNTKTDCVRFAMREAADALAALPPLRAREEIARIAWKNKFHYDPDDHQLHRSEHGRELLSMADAVLSLSAATEQGRPSGPWSFDQTCCDAIKEWLREDAPIGARENVHSGHIFWLMTRLKAALSAPPVAELSS